METYHSDFAYETQPLEENATHESPPFFDVEVDASSANAASAAAMREAMEKAQVKLKSAKELIDRKRGSCQSRTELRLNVDQRIKERGESRTCLQNDIFTEVQTREPCESRKNETVDFSMDGRWDAMNGTHVGPGFEHRMGYIELMNESIDKWQPKECASSLDTHKQEERVGEWKVEKQFYELVNNDKPKVAQEVIDQKGNEKTLKRPAKVPEHKKNEKKAATEDDVLEINVKLKAVQEACEQEDSKQKVKESKEVPEKEENVKKTISVQEAPEWGENEKKLKADEVTCECVQEKELKATKVTQDCEEARVGKKNETKLKTAKIAQECEDNEMQLKAASQHEGEKKRLKVARECEEEEKELKAVHEHEEEGKRLQPVCVHEEEENIHKVTRECEEEGNRPKAIHEPEVDGKKSEVSKEAYEREGTKLPEFEENLKATQEASEREEDVKKIQADSSVCDYEEEKKDEAVRQVDEIEKEMAVERKVCGDTVSEKKSEIGLEENNEGLKKVEDTNEVEEKVKKMKAANEVFSCEYTEQPSKIAGIASEQDEKGKIFQAKQGVGQWKGTESKLKENHKANGHKENENKFNPTKKVLLQDGNGRKGRAAQETYVQEASEKKLNYSHGAREQKENEKQSTETNALLKSKNMNGVAAAFDREQTKSEFLAASGFILGSDVGRKTVVAQSDYVSNGKAKRIREAPELTVIWDRKGEDKSQNGMYTCEEREIEERTQRDRELEKERLRKIEEEREREREREKDRIAVERATREVRDRACEEARERSERAVVERVTAEARQRALAEARERAEKATIDAGRLRVERAAVERGTAEAQERATTKALSERVVSREKPDGGMRQNYSFSGCHGTEDESAKRCKARLERHQRTVERAAKALAERNLRDILAQREQAERNRLAETLDADIRRWSNGKEGNLRALLSTLQYILGPESGWQPIPLTEVITAVAVKKAYRKATLCVHPDKVQQRGASIQQKYVCEKVFDLLKDAWNRFNSEER